MKLIDWFIYLSSNISSRKNAVNISIGKEWTAIYRLSIIWKSDLFKKNKLEFLQAVTVLVQLYGCTIWTLRKLLKKRLVANFTKILRLF